MSEEGAMRHLGLPWSRRGVLAGAAAWTAASFAAGRIASAAGGKGVINVYGGRWEKFWRETIVPPFEQETGNSAQLDIGLAKNWTATLRAAGVDNPPYDVIMLNEIYADLLRTEGYFEPWPEDKVPNLAKLYPVARHETSAYGMINPIALTYRTDMVKTPPTSWEDLWRNPEFKGRIGLYNIGNSAGYMFLLLVSKLFGGSEYKTDVGFQQIEKLLPFSQVDFSGTLGIQLSRGEVVVGPLDIPETVGLKKKGVPVDYVVPKEGVFMFEQAFDLLKASKNKQFAYDYLNYLLRSDVQEKLMREFFVSPTNREVVVPAELKAEVPVSGAAMEQILTWDWKAANAGRDAVIERWNRTIR